MEKSIIIMYTNKNVLTNYQKKIYNLGRIENLLEGQYRPGHLQGVCQVVDRLVEIG